MLIFYNSVQLNIFVVVVVLGCNALLLLRLATKKYLVSIILIS